MVAMNNDVEWSETLRDKALELTITCLKDTHFLLQHSNGEAEHRALEIIENIASKPSSREKDYKFLLELNENNEQLNHITEYFKDIQIRSMFESKDRLETETGKVICEVLGDAVAEVIAHKEETSLFIKREQFKSSFTAAARGSESGFQRY